MKSALFLGVLGALLAALAWSLNFIVPLVIGDYSIFDLALFRFLISGLIAFAYLLCNWNDVGTLTIADWLMSLALGLVGYFVYFQSLAGAALYAGPVIAPAFLALVPVVLAITGNLRQPTIAWRHLALPIMLATIGLPLAILAAACWVWFGLVNQSALAKRPQMPAGI